MPIQLYFPTTEEELSKLRRNRETTPHDRYILGLFNCIVEYLLREEDKSYVLHIHDHDDDERNVVLHDDDDVCSPERCCKL
jgi:hypothetical protein